jgi:hypothetical protein
MVERHEVRGPAKRPERLLQFLLGKRADALRRDRSHVRKAQALEKRGKPLCVFLSSVSWRGMTGELVAAPHIDRKARRPARRGEDGLAVGPRPARSSAGLARVRAHKCGQKLGFARHRLG